MLAATNPIEPLDVSGDFRITPLDVVQVINSIRRDPLVPTGFTDVDASGVTTSQDALLVVDSLRRAGGNREVPVARDPGDAEFLAAEGEFAGTLGSVGFSSIFAAATSDAIAVQVVASDVVVRISTTLGGGVSIESLSLEGAAGAVGINGGGTAVTLASRDDLNIEVLGDRVRIEMVDLDINDDVVVKFFGKDNELDVLRVATGDDFFAQFGRGIANNTVRVSQSDVGDDLMIDGGVVGFDVSLDDVVVGDDTRLRGGILDDSLGIRDLIVGDELSVQLDDGNDVIDSANLTVLDQAAVDLGEGDDTSTLDTTGVSDSASVATGDGIDRLVIGSIVAGQSLEIDSGSGINTILIADATIDGDLQFSGGEGQDLVTIDGALVGTDLRLSAEGSDDKFGVTQTRILDDFRVGANDGVAILAVTDSIDVADETRLENVTVVDVTSIVLPQSFDIIASSGSGTPNGITIPAPIIIEGDDIGNVRRFDGITGVELDPFATEFENNLLDPRDLVIRGDLFDPGATFFINTADFNNPDAPPTDGVIDQDGILQYDPAGNFIGVVADFTTNPDMRISAGGGVFAPTLDPDDDPDAESYFIGSRVQGDIFEIDPDTGEIIQSVPGTEDISFPRGFVFGPDGSLFLGSGSNPATGAGDDSILKIDPLTGATEVFFSTDLTGIAFSPLDVILSADGSSIITTSESPFSPGVVTPSNVLIIPLDFESPDEILILDPGLDDSGDPILVDPRGVGVAPDGVLYVSSAGNDKILRFNPDTGAFIDEFATAPGVNGQSVTFVPAIGINSPLEQTLSLLTAVV